MTPGRRTQARAPLRLFFGLWPGEALRGALAAAMEPAIDRVAGQPVPPGNLHVTLAFLGRTPASALVSLLQVGGRGPWPVVALAFESIEYWSRPKVLVAMTATTPVAAQAIVDRLWAGLEPIGFTREARPFRPHLTLVRRVRQAPPGDLAIGPVAADPADWRLALVESDTRPDGPRYRVLADWPTGDVS